MKIIDFRNYWICSNMDTLAPIIEEGIEYLLEDGSYIRVKEGNNSLGIDGLSMATDEEKKDFARRHYNTIFCGDTIIINRGRKMKGETKVVKGHYRFYVDGTYDKVYTDYLVFTDNTKCNINHCDVVGIEYKMEKHPYREYYEYIMNYPFVVGGRK